MSKTTEVATIAGYQIAGGMTAGFVCMLSTSPTELSDPLAVLGVVVLAGAILGGQIGQHLQASQRP